MKVLGIDWLGVRTEESREMLQMFQEVMGLKVVHREDENEFIVLQTSEGDRVELYGPKSKYNTHFAEAPVVGFRVDDIEGAREELKAKGIELIGEINRGRGGSAWQHFRGPDGNLYELDYDPRVADESGGLPK
jgi:catechol 2,3-dioxygenase-like lactoylglutathione lyase family enzyme